MKSFDWVQKLRLLKLSDKTKNDLDHVVEAHLDICILPFVCQCPRQSHQKEGRVKVGVKGPSDGQEGGDRDPGSIFGQKSMQNHRQRNSGQKKNPSLILQCFLQLNDLIFSFNIKIETH